VRSSCQQIERVLVFLRSALVDTHGALSATTLRRVMGNAGLWGMHACMTYSFTIHTLLAVNDSLTGYQLLPHWYDLHNSLLSLVAADSSQSPLHTHRYHSPISSPPNITRMLSKKRMIGRMHAWRLRHSCSTGSMNSSGSRKLLKTSKSKTKQDGQQEQQNNIRW
jgi:hypothetical protein